MTFPLLQSRPVGRSRAINLGLTLWIVLVSVTGQEPPATTNERVVAVLRTCDPARDGKGVGELFGADSNFDDNIVAVARDQQTGRVVRTRALRLARLLRLAQRLRGEPRDVAWWLAFAELTNEVPAALRAPLLARAGLEREVLQAVQDELRDASVVAGRFCLDWNEVREVGAEHAAQNRAYDELQTALTKAGAAAVPALLRILVVPPEVAFGQMDESRGITARQQVRAVFAVSTFLNAKATLPYLVMHSEGPSLTMSANASCAIERLTGQSFGAGFLKPGDQDGIREWWSQAQSEHALGLDHLVLHLVALAERDYRSVGAERSEGLWCAVLRLDRVLGKAEEPPSDATVEALRARLAEVELAWLERAVR